MRKSRELDFNYNRWSWTETDGPGDWLIYLLKIFYEKLYNGDNI